MLHATPDDAAYCPIPSCNKQRARVRFHVRVKKPVESSWGVRTGEVLVFECPSCGLRFRLPTQQHNAEDFYQAEYHKSMLAGHANQPRIESARRENLDRIRYFQKYCPKGTVLDVGCSTGLFARQLQDAGYEVFGSDVSEYACTEARKLLGQKVFCGRIEELTVFPENSLDGVTLMDVIEHFENLIEPLGAIHRCLKLGGVLFLRTPTVRSPFFRVADWSYFLSGYTFHRAVLKVYHAEHLFFFNESNIARLLTDVGYEVADIQPDWLLWENFRAAELHQGLVVNSLLAALYFLGRLLGKGHGMKVIAKKKV